MLECAAGHGTNWTRRDYSWAITERGKIGLPSGEAVDIE